MPALACTVSCAAREVMWAYRWPIMLGALAGIAAWRGGLRPIVLKVLLGLVGSLVGLAWALWGDIRYGLIDNNLGLCKGGTLEDPGPEGKRPGLSEWLHEGIQASAGLKATDRPLTFRDPGVRRPHQVRHIYRCTRRRPARAAVDQSADDHDQRHPRPSVPVAAGR